MSAPRRAGAADRGSDEDLFGEGREQAVQRMFDRVAPRYDLLNRLLTLGLDRRWRRRSVRLLDLPEGSLVADLACGTGDFCVALGRVGHVALGVDFSAGMLHSAPTGHRMVRGDVLALPLATAAIDGAVCGFALRNLADPAEFLSEVARAVRSGGRIALLEVSEPSNPLLRWGHRLYFGHLVPALGGLLSDRVAYRYLPESLRLLPSPAQLRAMLSAAGFEQVAHHRFNGGIAQLHTAARRC